MIESKLKETTRSVLKRWDKKLSEEEEPRVISNLESIEKDLDDEFESLKNKFREKISDTHEMADRYKDEIIKKAMENLVKSL